MATPSAIDAGLAETEKRNLRLYGYGAKGFTLSMIETAMDLTDSQVSIGVIRQILAAGREMLTEPVEPCPASRRPWRRCRSATAWC